MKVIFTFNPKDSFNSKEMMEGLSMQKDVQTFLRGYIDQEITVEMKPTAKLSEKVLLYNYYHRVVLGVAIECFENDGWEAMDKVKADYLLKMECGKELMYNEKTDKQQIYLFEKSAATKKDLHAFISRCITYLEVERGYIVPDSSSYKFGKESGLSSFKKV